MSDAPVVIVGAGVSGLAAARALDEAGVAYDIFDGGPRPGDSWARRYDRLHLHTVKQHSHIPGLPMPEDFPRYPARDQFVAYLGDVAATLSTPVRWGVRLERARRVDGSWVIDTSRGSLTAPRLVLATGYNRVPNEVRFPGDETFTGVRLHSSEYDNGERFRDQSVLVVGCGNSGAEIAIDLHEHGARPTMVVRAPTWVTPRDFLGMPSQVSSIRLSKLPVSVADWLGRTLLRVAVGDLSRWGIHRPTDAGPLRQIVEQGRVPILDIGTIDLIKDGKIRVAPGVKSLFERGARFADGSLSEFDAIVLATGYRTGLADLVEGLAAALDDRGYPNAFAQDEVLPGLHLVGFRNAPTGLIREVGLEAPRLAAYLAARPTSP